MHKIAIRVQVTALYDLFMKIYQKVNESDQIIRE